MNPMDLQALRRQFQQEPNLVNAEILQALAAARQQQVTPTSEVPPTEQAPAPSPESTIGLPDTVRFPWSPGGRNENFVNINYPYYNNPNVNPNLPGGNNLPFANNQGNYVIEDLVPEAPAPNEQGEAPPPVPQSVSVPTNYPLANPVPIPQQAANPFVRPENQGIGSLFSRGG